MMQLSRHGSAVVLPLSRTLSASSQPGTPAPKRPLPARALTVTWVAMLFVCASCVADLGWVYVSGERAAQRVAADLDLRTSRAPGSEESGARDSNAKLLSAASASLPPPLPVTDDQREACVAALGMRQVALLFLTTSVVYHEQLWALWLQQAEGLVPSYAGAGGGCGLRFEYEGVGESGAVPGRNLTEGLSTDGASAKGGPTMDLEAAHSACAPFLSPASRRGAGSGDAKRSTTPLSQLLLRQLLFNVYVHPQPSYSDPPGGVFGPALLPREQRVETVWGTQSLVDATKVLLRAALRNPRNAKLVLLSETTTPLYPPSVLYRQLLLEPLSRLNACARPNWYRAADQRWVPALESAELRLEHWRKSSQWFALTRRHAAAITADRAVERQFRSHCRIAYEPLWRTNRVCYPDEHYLPSVLAVLGVEAETDCEGQCTDADWDRRLDPYSAHPYTYRPDELTPQLFQRVRRSHRPGCEVPRQRAARAAAESGFRTLDEAVRGTRDSEADSEAAQGRDHLEAVEGRDHSEAACANWRRPAPVAPYYPDPGDLGDSLLAYRCPLWARKFPPDTQRALLR
ncbi:hypothetical protein H632_c1407p0, partial [Helicosporidium sp. ATCC 50920]